MVKQILCYRGKQSIEKYQFMDNEPGNILFDRRLISYLFLQS